MSKCEVKKIASKCHHSMIIIRNFIDLPWLFIIVSVTPTFVHFVEDCCSQSLMWALYQTPRHSHHMVCTFRSKTSQKGSDLENVSIFARLLQLTKKFIFCRRSAILNYQYWVSPTPRVLETGERGGTYPGGGKRLQINQSQNWKV